MFQDATDYALTVVDEWLTNWGLTSPVCLGYEVGWVCLWEKHGSFIPNIECLEALSHNGDKPWSTNDQASMCFIMYDENKEGNATYSVASTRKIAMSNNCKAFPQRMQHTFNCNAIKRSEGMNQ